MTTASPNDPALALVAPIDTPVPGTLEDVLDLMDGPVAPWAYLGLVERGSVEQGYEPYRITATLEKHDADRFRTVGVPGRLAILARNPQSASLSGAVWPVATMHPVDPSRVRAGEAIQVSWDVSSPDQMVSYDSAFTPPE